MSLLYFLEDLRTPLGDGLMSLITELGGEAGLICLALLVFWCVDKSKGYYLLSVGFFGIVVNEFLKLTFRIPRPWVLDPEFTIVESAREAATGYSFPSGHTQNGVGLWGGIARFTEKKWLRWAAIAVALLVAFSRMYLGVHTPYDVGVSLVTGSLMVFLLYPMVRKSGEDPKFMYKILALMVLLAAAYVLFTECFPFPADVDLENLAAGQKHGYSLLGAILAVLVVYTADQKWIHFPTKAVWWVQILKMLLGLGLTLGVKELMKAPLLLLCQGHNAAHLLRYFLMVLVAGALWPMTFSWFSKLGGGKATSSRP